MEIIRNKKFYHISTINNGKRLIAGEKIKTPIDGYNHFFGVYDVQDITFYQTYESVLQGLNYYWHFARETIFEEVRACIDDNLPSRKRCLWLCDENCLDYWINELKYDPERHQLLMLELDGKLLKCDASFVNGLPRKLYEVRIDARKYWNQQINNPRTIEYLFEGQATISKVLML